MQRLAGQLAWIDANVGRGILHLLSMPTHDQYDGQYDESLRRLQVRAVLQRAVSPHWVGQRAQRGMCSHPTCIPTHA